MRSGKQRLSGWSVIWILACLASGARPPASAAASGPIETPNWTAACADGSTVDLHASLAEGPVLVAFWALWCKPCLKELPYLDQLSREFQDRLTVLAVNIDTQRSLAKVAPFLRAQGYGLKVPLDTAGDISQAMQVAGTVPFLVLLDEEGREVYRHLGYKEGDEIVLRREIEAFLAEAEQAAAAPPASDAGSPAVPLQPAALGAIAARVSATDRLEYSYSTETEREICENWLDVTYDLQGFRTGLLLNSRQPSEEGYRENTVAHRFFAFSTGRIQVRVGHFYGLFGRGLVLSAHEDRMIRVDTALDGILIAAQTGRLRLKALSGTPQALDLDVRGLDGECDLGAGFLAGSCGLTYLAPAPAGVVNREWVGALRLQKHLSFADGYLELGWKRGCDFETVIDDRRQPGRALYGSLSAYCGAFTLTLEAKDYDRFAVLRRADGKVNLNSPPSLTREHLDTLPSRNAHNLDPDDEVGRQVQATWNAPRGWRMLACANRTERQRGDVLFEEAYGQVERKGLGRHRIRGACGYQDATAEQKGKSIFLIGEIGRELDGNRSLTLQIEHQHTELDARQRPDLGGILHPGAFDVQSYCLEYAVAPHWTFAALLETNNKILPEQQTEPGEKEGPFPAASIAYATSDGGTFSVWIGQRQAGQVCTGGVCKREPAFAGVELFWIFRY